MKKIFLTGVIAFSAIVLQAQNQTGAGGAQTGQGGVVPGQPNVAPIQPLTPPGQVNPQPSVPGTVDGAGVFNDPAGANRVSGVIPGNTNRIPFGGTNQPQFGGTNTGQFITDPSGAGTTNQNVPNQIPFGGTNQTRFGAPGQGAGLPTNNTPLAGSGTIQEPSGAAANQGTQAGTQLPGKVSADAAFAQQLNAALSRGGATRIFFPETRSTITLVNQNGSVLLTGVVADEQERQNIEARIRNAAGVNSVNNQLQLPNERNRALTPGQNPAAGGENQRQLLNP